MFILLLFFATVFGTWGTNISVQPFISRLDAASAAKFESVDWCSLNCGSQQNVACIVHADCLNIAAPCKLLSPNKKSLVNFHNYFRNFFATGADKRTEGMQASNMMLLNWDDALEYTAYCNLKSCPPKNTHDHCRRTEQFKVAGQNLFWIERTNRIAGCIRDLYVMVKVWYDEIGTLTLEEVKSYAKGLTVVETQNVGHFTQMTWATITHVGCALYENKGKVKTACMLACNYGPGGNTLNAPMYKIGTAASECPPGVPRNDKYPGLCGVDVTPERNPESDEDPEERGGGGGEGRGDSGDGSGNDKGSGFGTGANRLLIGFMVALVLLMWKCC